MLLPSSPKRHFRELQHKARPKIFPAARGPTPRSVVMLSRPLGFLRASLLPTQAIYLEFLMKAVIYHQKHQRRLHSLYPLTIHKYSSYILIINGDLYLQLCQVFLGGGDKSQGLPCPPKGFFLHSWLYYQQDFLYSERHGIAPFLSAGHRNTSKLAFSLLNQKRVAVNALFTLPQSCQELCQWFRFHLMTVGVDEVFISSSVQGNFLDLCYIPERKPSAK